MKVAVVVASNANRASGLNLLNGPMVVAVAVSVKHKYFFGIVFNTPLLSTSTPNYHSS
jgi:hypothetical protein